MGRHRKGWRDEVEPAYEEGGEAIGRAIMYDPESEAKMWHLLGGTGIWPRWYLKCFATLYRERNLKEYQNMRRNQKTARDRKARQGDKLEGNREQAADRQKS